jgi:hypothetical protein
MAKYRGWRILAVVDIPQAYTIKDVHDHNYGYVKFGDKVSWKGGYRPEKSMHTLRFLADKNDEESLSSRTYGGIKKLIDIAEEST